MPEAVAHRSETRGEVFAVAVEEITDGAQTGLFKAGLHGGANAPDDLDGLGPEECGGVRLAQDREAARLVEIGGDLGEELVVGQTDGGGNADFGLDAADQAGKLGGGGLAVEPLGASEIEKGFVEAERFDDRGEALHQRFDLAGDVHIGAHPGGDDDGVGAQLEGLKHRHGGTHALNAGNVAAGGDDPALAAADDDGVIGEGGIVAFLDAGIEGIAIDMGDGEGVEFGVMEEARGAAEVAAAGPERGPGQAVATEGLGLHLGSIAGVSKVGHGVKCMLYKNYWDF